MTMRLYTEEEARALLPEVIVLLERIRDGFRSVRAMQSLVAGDAKRVTADGNSTANPWAEEGADQVTALHDRIQEAAATLERWGLELKDPDRGLVDFFSERDGEVVYLCYLLGERDLLYWHRLADGFAGRRRL